MEKIIKHNGRKYRVIELIKEENEKLEEQRDFEKWSDSSYYSKKVKQNGYALKYVKGRDILEELLKQGYRYMGINNFVRGYRNEL